MFSNLNKLIVVHLIIASAVYNGCWAQEYFTSTAGMEVLLKTELQLTTEMQNYIDTLSLHLDLLQSEMDIIRHEHLMASEDLEGYLNNPINAYRLIKRLFSDWPTFEESVVSDTTRSDFLDNFEALKQNLSFPTQDDMVGSTKALVRLQETYNLDVAQVASGILNGNKYGSSMTWQDCFSIGAYLYAMSDYNHTIPWFKETTRILQSHENTQESHEVLDFMEIMIEYYRSMGDYESALQLVEHILEREPERETVLDVKSQLQEKIKEGDEASALKNTIVGNPFQKTQELFQQVCRGEYENVYTPHEKSLFCKLYTNNNPYLILQPYKVEQLSLDPYVIHVYDILTDELIGMVKTMAGPDMRRSTVYKPSTGEPEESDTRTSKTAWFRYHWHEHLERMRQHVADISGLDCRNTEDMQIVNYGIGGHYGPHFDFFTEASWFSADVGNRISTAMFYLSDVEEGGGTAFTFLKLLVRPRKGSLLLWNNLHASGHEDYRVNHGACPVLKGSKWIANVWIRERDQFLTRPCDLTTNHDVSLIYKNYG